jgi:amino acid transporter
MQNQLKRSLSLIDVVALGINGVIGTGIFLLPGIAAGIMGPASMLTLLFAALLSFLIALCFAEVGSQFRGTGGAYLYALRTFGDAPGFFVGWMVLVVTVTSWAAMVNGLASASARYLPELASGPIRGVAIIAFMAVLTGINLRGAKTGARVSVFFTVAKLIPLLLFVFVGLFYIDTAQFTPFAPEGYGSKFFEATLVILYAFVGFEALVVPAGEMANPRRAVPIALISVLVLVCLVYVGVLAVATGTLTGLAGHPNPVVASSEVFMGKWGAEIVSAGIIISMIGINSAQALVGPRRVFALAEQGHMPRALAQISSRGIPHFALIALFAVSGTIAVFGSFKTLALVSVVARFAQYIATCLGVIVLRRRRRAQARDSEDSGAHFSLPFGPVIPLAALALCAWLLIESGRSNSKPLIAGGIALLAGTPVYLGIRALARFRASE